MLVGCVTRIAAGPRSLPAPGPAALNSRPPLVGAPRPSGPGLAVVSWHGRPYFGRPAPTTCGGRPPRGPANGPTPPAWHATCRARSNGRATSCDPPANAMASGRGRPGAHARRALPGTAGIHARLRRAHTRVARHGPCTLAQHVACQAVAPPRPHGHARGAPPARRRPHRPTKVGLAGTGRGPRCGAAGPSGRGCGSLRSPRPCSRGDPRSPIRRPSLAC